MDPFKRTQEIFNNLISNSFNTTRSVFRDFTDSSSTSQGRGVRIPIHDGN